ncbi:MAG TPA: SRPBCC domain-containing protein [Gemmatimonadaceae bacterium]
MTTGERPAADDQPIVKDIYIDAPPRVVYTFLTKPGKVAQWIGTQADVDPQPGGIVRIVANAAGVIRGTYVALEPNAKVAFTWGHEGEGQAVPVGSTVVEITLAPDGGGTRLRLIHRGLTGESRAEHDMRWGGYTSRIKIAAEGGTPGPDPFARA